MMAGGGYEFLNNRKGWGRKRKISDSDISWMIDKAYEKPVHHGYLPNSGIYPVLRVLSIPWQNGKGIPRMANLAESTYILY